MRARSSKLLLAAGIGVIVLAASTERTDRPEGAYELHYLSVDRENDEPRPVEAGH